MDKLRHIAAKLKLEPGMHVAEIGSGWGALAIYLCKVLGVTVTAVNVSTEHRRCRAFGRSGRGAT